jgi:hypothetical protein
MVKLGEESKCGNFKTELNECGVSAFRKVNTNRDYSWN